MSIRATPSFITINNEPALQQVNEHQLHAIPTGKDPKRNYWKSEEEQILKDWADKAQCYEWMHLRSHIKYKSQNAWFTIPVIIISTITGTANFAQDRFGEAYKSFVVMGVGAFNIFAGIITTIYQFLKISELNEGHRVAALYWGKFYRNLRTELAKHPLDRSNHESVITNAKEEYDRLLEMSPMIPQKVLGEFNRKYGSMHGFTRPEIVTTRFGTEIYDMSDTDRKKMVEELLADKIAIEKERQIEVEKVHEDNEVLQHKLDILRQQLLDAENEKCRLESEADKLTAITQVLQPVIETPTPEDPELHKFKETFLKINGRYPNDIEVKNMFKSMYSTSPESSPVKDNLSLDFSSLKNTILTFPDYSNEITNL
jgi:hypothetical protein